MLLSLKPIRFLFNLNILLRSYAKTSTHSSRGISCPLAPPGLYDLGSGRFSTNIDMTAQSIAQAFDKNNSNAEDGTAWTHDCVSLDESLGWSRAPTAKPRFSVSCGNCPHPSYAGALLSTGVSGTQTKDALTLGTKYLHRFQQISSLKEPPSAQAAIGSNSDEVTCVPLNDTGENHSELWRELEVWAGTR